MCIRDSSIAAPDMGGAKRANTFAKLLGTPIIISHKERAKANVDVYKRQTPKRFRRHSRSRRRG